jgi:hypothetical protein
MTRTSPAELLLWAVALFLLYVAALIVGPPVAAALGSVYIEQPEVQAAAFDLGFSPVYMDHAPGTHQADAYQARNCMEHHGYKSFFVEKATGGIHFLCSYPGEDTVYTWVADWSKRLETFVERTAFPKSPNMSAARQSLLNKPGGGRWIGSDRLEHLYQHLIELCLK